MGKRPTVSSDSAPRRAGAARHVKLNLSQTHPELCKEADGWDPASYTSGSQAKVEWVCSKGHSWSATVKSRVQGRGCAVCSNKKVLAGFNDLATTHPEIAKEADGWDASEYTFGSAKKMSWVCPQGHHWIAAISDRRETGCAVCSGRKVEAGLNDLSTTHPKIAAQAYGWDPKEIREKSGIIKSWRCHLGHVWRASTAMRTRGNGCPYCSGAKVLVGFNDLATTHPDLAMTAVGWDPGQFSAGSGKKMRWVCGEGHQWDTRIISRTHGSGCPTCSLTQYDPNENGWLYFLRHENWDMLQIGITNQPEKRLAKHSKIGWDLIEVRGPMDGWLAREWETSMLKFLRNNGAKLGVESTLGKFDGYSEAWLRPSFPVQSIKMLMELVDAVKSETSDGTR